MTRIGAIPWGVAFLALTQTIQAQELRTLADGAIQHAASGLVFPATIGTFVRDGEPQRFEGTSDYGANYKDTFAGSDQRATLYV